MNAVEIIMRTQVPKCEHEWINMGYTYIHREDTARMYDDHDDIPGNERKDFYLYIYRLCNHCCMRLFQIVERHKLGCSLPHSN